MNTIIIGVLLLFLLGGCAYTATDTTPQHDTPASNAQHSREKYRRIEENATIQPITKQFSNISTTKNIPRIATLPTEKKYLRLIVDVATQQLLVKYHGVLLQQYDISTAKNGIGNAINSLQTPIGKHIIRKKIGTGLAAQTILKGRVNTQQIAEIISEPVAVGKDLVTSRILWLAGLEDGVNKGRDAHGQIVDSYQRYIYIHGTNEEGLIGSPASNGCVRMRNEDVIQLYTMVAEGTEVVIR